MNSHLRRQSLNSIEKLGYKGNPNLPLLDEGIKIVHNSIAIANRINILHLLYTTSHEGQPSVKFFFEIIQKNGWTPHLTKKEIAYFSAGKLSTEDKIKLSWYKESLNALAWATGLVNDLRNLKEINMASLYPLIPPEASEEKFLASLKLRDKTELLQELDLFYLLHWSAKHEKNEGVRLFSFLSKQESKLPVIAARRHALEWLFSDENWDEVPLDT